jgi:hypothetical protein
MPYVLHGAASGGADAAGAVKAETALDHWMKTRKCLLP